MSSQAEANLSALIESTEDLIWSVDLEYRLITFNRAFEQDIKRNYGVQAAPGMRPEDLLPPARAALWDPFYKRAQSEGSFRIEYVLAKDGPSSFRSIQSSSMEKPRAFPSSAKT